MAIVSCWWGYMELYNIHDRGCLSTLCVRVFSLQIENTSVFHRIWSAQIQLKSMIVLLTISDPLADNCPPPQF